MIVVKLISIRIFIKAIVYMVCRLCFVLFLINSSLTSFGQDSFEISYATTDDEGIISGILHSSGKVYLVGRRGTYDSSEYSPIIMKIDPDGQFEVIYWNTPDTNGFFNQILELDNNNLMLIGQFNISSGTDYPYRWLRIIDPNLNILSEFHYYQDSIYTSVTQGFSLIDSEGNIVVLGDLEFNTNTPGYTTTDFFMAKYSQEGDSLDFHIYNFPDHREYIYDLTTIPETDQYLAVTSAFSIGMPSPQIVRIDHDLNIIDNHWFSVSEFGASCSLNHWLTDATFLICGYYNILPPLGEDQQIGVMQADTNAAVLNHVHFGKPDTIDNPAPTNSLAYVNDTTIYVGGYINYVAFWPTEPSFLELYIIDTNLNLIGYKQFGGDINYRLKGILNTTDGGCLIYSSTYSDSNNYHERDIRIFKVPRDSIDIVTGIVNYPSSNICSEKVLPYPNPVKNTLNIPLGRIIDNVTIKIFTTDGKKILEKQYPSSGNLVNISIDHLPAGVYVYKLFDKNHISISGKFMIE